MPPLLPWLSIEVDITMQFTNFVAKVVNPMTYRRRLGIVRERLQHFGLRRYCPCCGSHLRRFLPHWRKPNPEVICPVCGAMSRHRFIYLLLKHKTDLFDHRQKRMLHIAPEPQLSQLFRGVGSIDYLSADLYNSAAMVRMDITDIQYPDDSFDVIYCSHVLEHVSDDRKAMREFHRVLKPGGRAYLMVPIKAEPTIEDPTVTSPEERLRLFGQEDHVRCYGPDFTDRLAEAGFSVTVENLGRTFHARALRRMGLADKPRNVFVCQKVIETAQGINH